MFPLDLSDGVFSLSPDKFRNCLSFYASLAEDGSIEDFDVKAHRVKCTRMTYDEVDTCLSSSEAQGVDAEVQSSLQARPMHVIAPADFVATDALCVLLVVSAAKHNVAVTCYISVWMATNIRGSTSAFHAGSEVAVRAAAEGGV